jgi:hypothetical protein
MEQGVVVEPGTFDLAERLEVLSLLGRGALLKPLEGPFQHAQLPGDQRLEFHRVFRKGRHALEVRRLQPPAFQQILDGNEERVPGEAGTATGRRVAVTRGPEGQDLPDSLCRIRQKVGEAVSLAAEFPNAVWSGKRRGMQEYPADATEIHRGIALPGVCRVVDGAECPFPRGYCTPLRQALSESGAARGGKGTLRAWVGIGTATTTAGGQGRMRFKTWGPARSRHQRPPRPFQRGAIRATPAPGRPGRGRTPGGIAEMVRIGPTAPEGVSVPRRGNEGAGIAVGAVEQASPGRGTAPLDRAGDLCGGSGRRARPEGRVTVVDFHAVPPTCREWALRRNATFRARAGALAKLEGPPLVVGDHNASPWSGSHRGDGQESGPAQCSARLRDSAHVAVVGRAAGGAAGSMPAPRRLPDRRLPNRPESRVRPSAAHRRCRPAGCLSPACRAERSRLLRLIRGVGRGLLESEGSKKSIEGGWTAVYPWTDPVRFRAVARAPSLRCLPPVSFGAQRRIPTTVCGRIFSGILRCAPNDTGGGICGVEPGVGRATRFLAALGMTRGGQRG